MIKVLQSLFRGPLEPYAAGFAAELEQQGYTVTSARGHVGFVAHLDRWMSAAGLGVGELDESVRQRYLAERRAGGYTLYLTGKALAPLVEYLHQLGALKHAPSSPVSSPAELLLERYRDYLLSERGLGAASVRGYLELVRPFVEQHAHEGQADLQALTPEAVTTFLVAESARLSAKTLQRQASALRSLLRFWHVTGVIPTALVTAVPKVAHRHPRLPRSVSPQQLAALLDSCDRTQPAGLRDYAMLLLSRLGMRAGEVAGLQLEEIDSRAGEITVRGKGHRRDRLPLPSEVGEAVADYLQHGRPAAALDRSLFTRVLAPHRGLSATGVTQAVVAASARAGLGTVYAHRLRHTAATAMLAAGGSLPEIGQVLRHRRPETTAIYATVDTEALRSLVRPWPAGGVS
jgi:site-specific recombinase XerD